MSRPRGALRQKRCAKVRSTCASPRRREASARGSGIRYGGVATCSEGYRKLYGLDPKGPGHQSPEDWLAQVHPDDRNRVQWFKGTSLTSGRIKNEYRIVRPDGSVRWIVDRGVPIYDSKGTLVRVLGANVDITEAREAEERLRELQSQVLHASRLSAMGQMAAALAHELN